MKTIVYIIQDEENNVKLQTIVAADVWRYLHVHEYEMVMDVWTKETQNEIKTYLVMQ